MSRGARPPSLDGRPSRTRLIRKLNVKSNGSNPLGTPPFCLIHHCPPPTPPSIFPPLSLSLSLSLRNLLRFLNGCPSPTYRRRRRRWPDLSPPRPLGSRSGS
ncbi:hypothetical protein NL676_018369 [Syzygium grande]|nr:hypothetical protein NL676_018369 [Syzygium grande]